MKFSNIKGVTTYKIAFDRNQVRIGLCIKDVSCKDFFLSGGK